MVGDAARTTRTGSPKLEVEAVENSHFLRRNQPDKTYSSTTITNILKDLVETFTPVTWVACSATDAIASPSDTRRDAAPFCAPTKVMPPLVSRKEAIPSSAVPTAKTVMPPVLTSLTPCRPS